jgi:hypothetical protein
MNNSSKSIPSEALRAPRGAGIALIIATLLGVLVLAHHPGAPYRELVLGGEVAARVATLSGWVHGTLMVLLVVSYYCLVEFAVQRDLRRPSVRMGLIAYSVGLVAMLGAATIDGFVSAQVPVAVARMANSGVLQEPTVVRQLLVLAFTLNHALANVGAVAMSLGIAIWSLSLLRGAALEKAVGAAGVLIGLVTVPALITGLLFLDRHGILILEAAQALWNLGIGVLLLRPAGSAAAR